MIGKYSSLKGVLEIYNAFYRNVKKHHSKLEGYNIDRHYNE